MAGAICWNIKASNWVDTFLQRCQRFYIQYCGYKNKVIIFIPVVPVNFHFYFVWYIYCLKSIRQPKTRQFYISNVINLNRKSSQLQMLIYTLPIQDSLWGIGEFHLPEKRAKCGEEGRHKMSDNSKHVRNNYTKVYKT